MKSYSLGRVAQYARYHYMSQNRNYLSIMLVMIGCMSIVGILARDLMTSVDVCLSLYIFAGVAYAARTTSLMREREYKIRECTLPISNEERMTFMIFNLMVAFPLSLLLCLLLSLVIVFPFSWHADMSMVFNYVMDEYMLQWPLYALSQIVCSSSLLINLVARRSLPLAYLIAFVVAIASMVITGKGVEVAIENGGAHVELWHLSEEVAKTIFVLIPVCFYALAYLALRKRQIRW